MKTILKKGLNIFCKKGSLLLIMLSAMPLALFAQEKGEISTFFPKTEQEWMMFALLALIITVAILVLLVSVYTIVILQTFLRKEQEKKGLVVEGFWAKLNKRLTNAVPLSKEKDIVLDHNYDGIRELDNHLPPWWVAMFYITIVFAIIYLAGAHIGDFIPTSDKEWQTTMAQAEKDIAAYKKTMANSIDENNVELSKDKAEIADGKAIFDKNCIACHGKVGEGTNIAPNLTDKFWKHGGSIKHVFTTIKYGIVEKGMKSWEKDLKPDQIRNVASYILSLQGSNPPNAKEPEGEEYIPEKEEKKEKISLK